MENEKKIECLGMKERGIIPELIMDIEDEDDFEEEDEDTEDEDDEE